MNALALIFMLGAIVCFILAIAVPHSAWLFLGLAAVAASFICEYVLTSIPRWTL